VDPNHGAWEKGEPPSRYFVAYTPVQAALLALVAPPHALPLARLWGATTWFFALAWCVWRAAKREASTGQRVAGPTALAALFLASTFLFARWAACAKPDAPALLLVAFAFARTLDRGAVDGRSAVLFALAAILKPSVVGVAIGATVSSMIVSVGTRAWTEAIRPPLAAGVVFGGAFGALHVVSGGRALPDLFAAAGLAFDAHQLATEAPRRVPFVAGLIFVAAVIATRRMRSSAPAERRRGFIALGAVCVSMTMSTIALGKRGATINYLMEPALASLVVVSQGPWELAFGARPVRRLAAGRSVLSALWSGNATVRSLIEEASSRGDETRALSRIASQCLRVPPAFVMSDDPGVELLLNGRIHTHAVELANAVERGGFAASTWARDVERPEVTCYVTFAGDQPIPAPGRGLPDAVRRALEDRFVFGGFDGGFAVFVARRR